MGQKDGEKWTAAVDLQPTLPKSDRLLGPGYRVYYTERDGALIILLAGGDKSTQQKDIAMALELARHL